MASAKLQKPTNQTDNDTHDNEHKFSQKMPGMAAWGNKVFGGGHKQQERKCDQHHTTEKTTWFGNKQTTNHVQHCSCQCKTSDKNLNPTCTDNSKKEPSAIKDTKCNACNDTKKRQEHLKSEKREERKQNVRPEVKKEKTEVQTKVVPVKGSNACSEVKKERKEEHVTGKRSNTCCATKKKEHREECAANHCFGNMADHWIEKISMMKKDKESNSKCSNNSSSDSEDEAGGKNKKEKRRPTGAKNTSK